MVGSGREHHGVKEDQRLFYGALALDLTAAFPFRRTLWRLLGALPLSEPSSADTLISLSLFDTICDRGASHKQLLHLGGFYNTELLETHVSVFLKVMHYEVRLCCPFFSDEAFSGTRSPPHALLMEYIELQEPLEQTRRKPLKLASYSVTGGVVGSDTSSSGVLRGIMFRPSVSFVRDRWNGVELVFSGVESVGQTSCGTRKIIAYPQILYTLFSPLFYFIPGSLAWVDSRNTPQPLRMLDSRTVSSHYDR